MSVRTVYDARFGQFGYTEGVFDPTTAHNDRFTEALLAGSREETHELRHAILAHQFSVYYQPVIDVTSGDLVGAEALLRWHRNGELLPAERFLRFAERSGLIVRLGSRVFRDVAAFHARAGLPPDGGLRFAVNLSRSEVLHPHIGEIIVDALRTSGRSPEMIEVEVSEKDLAFDPRAVTAALQRLWDAGIGCTLDDFGASTLDGAHLGSLPLLAAKLDLPQALRTEEALRGQARLVERAHALDLPVIAKRVSSYDHLELLSWLEIRGAQGNALGAPAPASVFRGLLRDAGLLSLPGPRPLSRRSEQPVVSAPAHGGRPFPGAPPQPSRAAT